MRPPRFGRFGLRVRADAARLAWAPERRRSRSRDRKGQTLRVLFVLGRSERRKPSGRPSGEYSGSLPFSTLVPDWAAVDVLRPTMTCRSRHFASFERAGGPSGSRPPGAPAPRLGRRVSGRSARPPPSGGSAKTAARIRLGGRPAATLRHVGEGVRNFAALRPRRNFDTSGGPPGGDRPPILVRIGPVEKKREPSQETKSTNQNNRYSGWYFLPHFFVRVQPRERPRRRAARSGRNFDTSGGRPPT